MDHETIDLRSLLETLRRQMALFVATVVLCLAVAAVYLFSVTPLYTASTLVLMDPSQKNLLDPNSVGNLNQNFANSRIDSEVEILRSDAVALSVVKEQYLYRDPEFGPKIGLLEKTQILLGIQTREQDEQKQAVRNVVTRLKNAMDIRRKGQTFLISVAVSSVSPTRAAELSNAVSNSYIALQVGAKIKSSMASRDILQGQIINARESLARSEDALDRFIEENVARIEAETGRTDIATLVDALGETQQKRLKSEVILSQAQGVIESQNWSALAADLESEILSELERERAGIEQRLGRVVEGSQESIDLRAEIEALEVKLQEESKKSLGSLRQNMSILASKEEETRAQLRETLLSGQLPSDLLANIYEIQQDAANLRSQYQNLLVRTRDVETQAGVQIADSRVVSEALVPTNPSFPNTELILAIALIVGCGLGILNAFLREFFVGGFTSSEQLQAALNSPVVSTVPLVGANDKGETSPADKVVNAPMSVYSESIRRLRASVDQHLQQPASGSASVKNKAPIVLVTSSIQNEGKTTTALALARTYSSAGKKVLLIDADLRSPSLHDFVMAEPNASFLDYLATPDTEASKEEFFVIDHLTNLTLILGRSRSSVPTDQLVSSKAFEELLESAQRLFDIIILDSPPLLLVVDGLYLAKYADIAVFVVRHATTGQAALRSVRATFRDALKPGSPILGVLNGTALSKRSYYGGYYGKS